MTPAQHRVYAKKQQVDQAKDALNREKDAQKRKKDQEKHWGRLRQGRTI